MVHRSAPDETLASQSSFRRVSEEFATARAVLTVSQSTRVLDIDVDSLAVASQEPPLVMVAVDNRSLEQGKLQAADRFVVNLMSYAPVSTSPTAGRLLEGLPMLDAARSGLACCVVDTHPAGDHTLIIGQVEAVAWRDILAAPDEAPAPVEFTSRHWTTEDWPAEMDYAC